jgi:hypothetical protein
MKASRWYKEFGGDREERYYHITEIEEGGRVSGRLYIYNSLFRKVVKEESRRFDDKWWMEQELRNSVHEVAESSIPFLMKF